MTQTWHINLYVTCVGTRDDAENIIIRLEEAAAKEGATLAGCDLDAVEPPPPTPWVSLMHIYEWYPGIRN
jgi:hypothetical protein